jgi:hypothetical protein
LKLAIETFCLHSFNFFGESGFKIAGRKLDAGKRARKLAKKEARKTMTELSIERLMEYGGNEWQERHKNG